MKKGMAQTAIKPKRQRARFHKLSRIFIMHRIISQIPMTQSAVWFEKVNMVLGNV